MGEGGRKGKKDHLELSKPDSVTENGERKKRKKLPTPSFTLLSQAIRAAEIEGEEKKGVLLLSFRQEEKNTRKAPNAGLIQDSGGEGKRRREETTPTAAFFPLSALSFFWSTGRGKGKEGGGKPPSFLVPLWAQRREKRRKRCLLFLLALNAREGKGREREGGACVVAQANRWREKKKDFTESGEKGEGGGKRKFASAFSHRKGEGKKERFFPPLRSFLLFPPASANGPRGGARKGEKGRAPFSTSIGQSRRV